MKLLRRGSKGAEVVSWQQFLRGMGYRLLADGDFGPRTYAATMRFQARHGLKADGIVGGRTMGKALNLGCSIVEVPGDDWPPKPNDIRPLRGNSERARRYGRFQYTPSPTRSSPENIRILNNWVRRNIVWIRIPQILRLFGRSKVAVHIDVVEDLTRLWDAWDRYTDLNRLALSFNGSFVPRFVRGSDKTLSNHSWGTAFDINARYNRIGTIPALKGEKGSVRELVGVANELGWYWGGHFKRRDGMHFERGVVISSA